MKNSLPLLLFTICLTGCIKTDLLTDTDKVMRPLLGKWYNTYEKNSSATKTNFRRTHVAEFHDSTFSIIFRERTVNLPDCTLVSRYERILHANYKEDWKFLKLTNMQQEINGTTDYSGKKTYVYFEVGYSELFLGKAEVWKQLSGNPGQLKDGLFYYHDSIVYQDFTKKYIHFHLKFTGIESIELKNLGSDNPEMPTDDANWTISEFSSQTTDSTFTSLYGQSIYKFYDGILVSYGVTSKDEFYQGYRK